MMPAPLLPPPAAQRVALREFEALERQEAPHLVLRDVSNSPTRQRQQLQGAPASAGKKAAADSGPLSQWQPPPAGSSAGEFDDDGDVYESEGDGNVQEMSYATAGGAPLAPWPRAAGAPRWLAGDDEQEDEGECLQAEVGWAGWVGGGREG